MKTVKYIILTTILAALVFSCELPVALGNKLDLLGPVVEISSPAPRKAVTAQFEIEGSIYDDGIIKEMLITATREGLVCTNVGTPGSCSSTNPCEAFHKQWRYTKGGKWFVSEYNGVEWIEYTDPRLKWDGTASSALWTLPIDMTVNGERPKDGEYLFKIQAWDEGGWSDDNSLRTRVLIFDSDPPKVSISNPFIHLGKGAIDDDTDEFSLGSLHLIDDLGEERFDPSYIGQFYTQGFLMQWQLEDKFDIWSIAIRFYDQDDQDTDVDGYPQTPLPENYIYSYTYNFPNLPPEVPDSSLNAMPNGWVLVPDLTSAPGIYEGAELKKSINTKTTIKVVTVCYDAAGNVNQEKVLGYFIYWPLADYPWITYTDGMDSLAHYESKWNDYENNNPVLTYKEFLDQETFMIYPGRTIRSTAFHAHGTKEVIFSLYAYDPITKVLSEDPYAPEFNNRLMSNTQRPNGDYSTVFSWEFRPPNRSGYYLLSAVATSINDKKSEEKIALFRVQDISFPDFVQPINPVASDPLYIEIGNSADKDSITISGIVRDATEVVSLDMVWINPQSKGYAAMSQLSYFREPGYEGWKMAGDLTPNGNPAIEGLYDPSNQNRVYRLALNEIKAVIQSNNVYKGEVSTKQIFELLKEDFVYETDKKIEEKKVFLKVISKNDRTFSLYKEDNVTVGNGENLGSNISITIKMEQDIETQRERFLFSRTIPLSEFNIGVSCTCLAGCEQGKGCRQPLISQMFLFRAENPDKRTTIITYAPQGDTSPPVINIENIVIGNTTYKPRAFAVLPQFDEGDTIQVNGTWREDSSAKLDINKFFTPNFNVEINGKKIQQNLIDVSTNTIETMEGVDINWRAEITVGSGANQILKTILTDTLVVNSTVSDIGGNKAESGVSWLIESDHLRLMRISSEDQDGTYNTGKDVIIFLEFSKPVTLSNTGSNPTLRLNSRGAEQGTFATAVYITDDPEKNKTQSTRQYFKYTVAANDDTTKFNGVNQIDCLDVVGLDTSIDWKAGNYPFTWYRGTGDTREEIRVTTVETHNNNTPTDAPSVSSGQIYARCLPTTPINNTPSGGEGADYMFTFIAGKRITIDTAAPVVSSIVPKTPAGDYTTGAEIAIDVTFNKPVRLGGTLPRLNLQVTNGGTTTVQTSDTASDVRVSGDTVSFIYRVKAGDTTNGNAVIVTGHTGVIEDLAGTPLATNGISNPAASVDKTLSGRFIDTITPGVPRVRIYPAASTTSAITNIVNSATHTADSTSANRTLANVYQSGLRLSIQGDTAAGAHKLQRLEYSITAVAGTDPTNYITFVNKGTNTININNTLYALDPGTYNIRARQVDRAGNMSAWSNLVSFTYMTPGDFVTRIDSSSANGTYTNNGIPVAGGGRQDNVNVTVYFRENITTSGTGTGVPTITLNASYPQGAGTANRTVTASNITTAANSISFTYQVQTTDNTSSGVNLDVTAMSITAADTAGVNVSSLLTVPGGSDTTNVNRLRNRKSIKIVTGDLTLASGVTAPTWTASNSTTIRNNDEWTGKISLRFNRDITKGSGNVVITQDTAGYRLPAVLTDAQSAKYKSTLFNSFYTRGTNGSVSGAADTSTKWILNYGQTTVVTPSNTGGATDIQKLAYEFHQAETVTIPVSSEDIEINGDTLTVHIKGSNALAVLGAQHNVTFSTGFIQDSLGYSWPPASTQYTNGRTTEINRPFIRIDKRVNKDTIAATGSGSTAIPHLNASYADVLSTTARFDCRTPSSVVRYTSIDQAYEATGVTGMGGWGPAGASNWVNNPNDPIDNNSTGIPAIASGATTYSCSNFNGTTAGSDTNINTGTATLRTIGNSNEQGYIWRVSASSQNSAGTVNSNQYEELAFRTVLTYRIVSMAADNNYGRRPQSGDQLWIRGGDAVSSSSVPGFPLTWDDDYAKLESEKRRAGVRLLEMKSATNLYTAAVWKYVTWEINVRTWFDIVNGRGVDTTTAQAADNAWQYGPLQCAYSRGGWIADKNNYTLYPGKHRWVDVINSTTGYNNGAINFSFLYNARENPSTVTLTQ